MGWAARYQMLAKWCVPPHPPPPAFIANVGPLVQPVDKRTLAKKAPRPPSLYSHNTQRLTAQNVHAQASSSAKGVMGRMLSALAVESPSGEPPHRVRSYSIAGNTKILEARASVAPPAFLRYPLPATTCHTSLPCAHALAAGLHRGPQHRQRIGAGEAAALLHGQTRLGGSHEQ